jgi:hypothetical protein
MILCQKTIIILVNYLIRKCKDYRWNWNKYSKNDQADAFYEKRLFLTVMKTYNQIHGLCQNIGLAIYDYFHLYGQIESNINIKEEDFMKPLIPDPEITVSERIGNLDRETENCLLMNPEKSILGFAAVRMELESFIAIKLQDKMRQNIRIKDGNNKRDVKYTSKLQPIDIRMMVKDILPYQKEYKALDMVYEVSSKTVHRAIPVANYLSWGSWIFMFETLRKNIDNLNPTDARLENTMKKLENEGKLRIVPLRLYI